MSGHVPISVPVNEPVRSYAPGSPERASLKAELDRMAGDKVEIPLVIGGQRVRTGKLMEAHVPHRHAHVLATCHSGGATEVNKAIEAAEAARREWASWRWEDRAAVFLKAADLLAGPWRDVLNASTMLGQSKTVHQAEIDAACEMVDFLRFNVWYADKLQQEQPLSAQGAWNRMEYRPLDGFVYAVTPFNFTSIGGNLPSAPAILGNTVLWKPSSTALLSAWWMFRLFEEAGMPPGVINFVPGDAAAITDVVLAHPAFGGIHFTGSTGVFQSLWRRVGENIAAYRTYPRLVGETGGKDFIIAHESADVAALRTAIIRGGFEYQGQKCSAVSRVYVPASVWKNLRDDLVSGIDGLPMGDVTDFRNFTGAVINRHAFDKISGYIEGARKSKDARIIAGGKADGSEGWYIRPTLIEAMKADYVTMCEEIFGPVVSIHVYRDNDWAGALKLVDETSPYALTGAVFAQDRKVIRQATDSLRHAAGNFYVNDKPTGAVVGQQPFGGSRASGTNDKAGSGLNMMRWTSPRVIKENFVPDTDWRYPFMEAE